MPSGPTGGNTQLSRLAPLSANYAKTLVDPFTGPSACIPDFPSVPSLKSRVFAKGVAYTGTASFGYVAINPRAAVASDQDFVSYTDATYALSTVSTAAALTAKSNSQFAAADIGVTDDLATSRIVSAGIRARYQGTELNRGGVFLGFQHPTHASLDNSTFPDVDGNPLSKRFPVTREWMNLTYCPVLTSELTYQGTVALLANAYMIIMMQAPDPTVAMSVEWEAYVNIEYNGRNVRGMSLSGSDPVGFAAVHTVANSGAMAPFKGDAKQRSLGFVQKVIDWGENTASNFVNGAGRFIEKSAGKAVDIGLEALAAALLV